MLKSKLNKEVLLEEIDIKYYESTWHGFYLKLFELNQKYSKTHKDIKIKFRFEDGQEGDEDNYYSVESEMYLQIWGRLK